MPRLLCHSISIIPPPAQSDDRSSGIASSAMDAARQEMKMEGNFKKKKAKKDHAERLARIQAAQTSPEDLPAARGLPDFDPNPESADNEKARSQDTTTQDTTANMGRGEAR